MEIHNYTEINYKQYLKFYEFIFNLKLDSKFFKYFMLLLGVFSLAVVGYFIYFLTTDFNIKEFTSIKLMIMAILSIPIVIFILLSLKLNIKRSIYFKIILILVLIDVLLSFLPNPDMISIIIIVVFVFFILQIILMPNKLAKKSFLSKGITKYDYYFKEENFCFNVQFIDFQYDEESNPKQVIQNVENKFEYDKLLILYYCKNQSYLKLEDGKYIFIDNTNFEDFNAFLDFVKSKNILIIPFEKL